MTEAVNLAAKGGYFMRVSALALVDIDMFDMLLATTNLQPFYDPNAGYGPYHVVKTFFELGLAEAQYGLFYRACSGKASIAYVMLRAIDYQYFDQALFLKELNAGCFSARGALDHLRKFLPDFATGDGRHRLEADVTTHEDNHANQTAHRGKKPKRRNH